jgi:hypothetical protein
MGRPRGRPISRPERAAFFTFVNIDSLRRIALLLAPGELAPDEVKRILASLPMELWEEFRLIIGRHRRYIVEPLRHSQRRFTPRMQQELAIFAKTMKVKPNPDDWSVQDWQRFDRAPQLRSAKFGPSTARKIARNKALPNGLSLPGVTVLAGNLSPAYLGGLWRDLDKWGAAKHGVTLATFRSWRTKLRKAGYLKEATPREHARRVRH